MENMLETIQTLVTTFGLKIVAALALFVVGRWVARFLKSFTKNILTRKNVEPTIVAFTGNLTYIAMMAFVILGALGQLGIQTTSFIAVIGAAGLAIGLALQGSLANFAAGFLLILFRPFKVGDFIEAAGVVGSVEEIQVFTTHLKTPDNKKIIVPNSKLTSDNIINYSANDTRRVDMTFGVGYGDNLDKVKTIISDVLTKDGRVLKDPAPTVALSELADSSVNFVVRPWVKSEDYWGVMFDTQETMKKRFDEEGINIPFPQRDVHLYEHKA
ncbi:MAG TPA: mechanosensitive ion channel domain-containing protein [Nitrospiria bacterium]